MWIYSITKGGCCLLLDISRNCGGFKQAERAQEQSVGSHGSGSSSDPSEEVLDDPTNIALSQRAPARLQQGGVMPPHGDPLLQAAQAELGQQAASMEEPLPVRGMPSKQKEWVRKRGVLVLLDIQPVLNQCKDSNTVQDWHEKQLVTGDTMLLTCRVMSDFEEEMVIRHA